MLKKGKKFKLGNIVVEIISASNSNTTNNGYNICKTTNCIFKLHYTKILEII